MGVEKKEIRDLWKTILVCGLLVISASWLATPENFIRLFAAASSILDGQHLIVFIIVMMVTLFVFTLIELRREPEGTHSGVWASLQRISQSGLRKCVSFKRWCFDAEARLAQRLLKPMIID